MPLISFAIMIGPLRDGVPSLMALFRIFLTTFAACVVFITMNGAITGARSKPRLAKGIPGFCQGPPMPSGAVNDP